jgi:hypothetical protein
LLGLALLSKFTALFLIPAYVILAAGMCFYCRSVFMDGKKVNVIGLFSLMALISFIVLWTGYLFELRPLLSGVLRADQKETFFMGLTGKIFPGGPAKEIARNFIHNVPVPLSSFFMGIAGIIRHSAEGTRTFFMGEWGDKGNSLYYLLAFLIKTPIPVMIGFFAGIFVALRNKIQRNLVLYFISVITVFFIMASRSDLQIGLRYLLPVYPLIFIISSVGIISMFKTRHALKFLASILIVWMIGLHCFIWPDYLSYFNEIIGGPEHGHLYLRDSNIDWGQDLPALKKYMDQNGIDEIRLVYFGTADPSYYGIKHVPAGALDLKTAQRTVYAISVHYLETVEWTGTKSPSGKAGRSIMIYDMR